MECSLRSVLSISSLLYFLPLLSPMLFQHLAMVWYLEVMNLSTTKLSLIRGVILILWDELTSTVSVSFPLINLTVSTITSFRTFRYLSGIYIVYYLYNVVSQLTSTFRDESPSFAIEKYLYNDCNCDSRLLTNDNRESRLKSVVSENVDGVNKLKIRF